MKLQLRDLHSPLAAPVSHSARHAGSAATICWWNCTMTKVKLGERRALPRAWPQYSVASMRAALESARQVIQAQSFTAPRNCGKRVQPWLADEPFALGALDEAAHDLWGQREGQPVWKLWGCRWNALPCSGCNTIGLETPRDRMIAKMKRFEGFADLQDPRSSAQRMTSRSCERCGTRRREALSASMRTPASVRRADLGFRHRS